MNSRLFVCLVAFGLPRVGVAAPADEQIAAAEAAPEAALGLEQVIVIGFERAAVPDDLVRNIEEILISTLRKARPDVQILGESELKTMLTVDQHRQAVGCTDAACLAEVGGALGADHIVSGSLGRVGDLYLLTLKLINTREARVANALSDRTPGPPERLIALTEIAAYKLVGLSPPQISIDKVMAAPQPAAAAVQEDTPFYQTWWFWTIAGVVVAGGAAAGIVVATQGGEAPIETASGSLEVEITP